MICRINNKGPEGPFSEIDPALNSHPGLAPGSILGIFAIYIGQLGSRIKSTMTFQSSVVVPEKFTFRPASSSLIRT